MEKPTMSEAYTKAIDLIADGSVDYRRIALELAKAFPEAFLLLHEGVPERQVSLMDRKLLTLLRASQKVEAIKLCRSETGKSLKEAKDYCDDLDERDKRGGFNPSSAPSKTLSERLREKISGVPKTAEPTW